MEQVLLIRQSGLPLDLSDIKLYEEAWKAFFDKASERAGLDMLKKQRFLAFGEHLLLKKFDRQTKMQLPATVQELQDFIEKYGDTPVMFARKRDADGIIAIIMDQLQ